MNIVSSFSLEWDKIERGNDWFLFFASIQWFFRVFAGYVWHDVNKDTIFYASSLYNSRGEERNIRGIILSSNTKFTILLISRSFENFFENCSNNSLRSRNEFSALDLSKGSFVSANLIQSSRRKKRFSGHKPRSRLSSSRLNYDHSHYSGQTRLSVSTRPSPLAAIPDYSRETASIRGVSVISVTSDRDTFYPEKRRPRFEGVIYVVIFVARQFSHRDSTSVYSRKRAGNAASETSFGELRSLRLSIDGHLSRPWFSCRLLFAASEEYYAVEKSWFNYRPVN